MRPSGHDEVTDVWVGLDMRVMNRRTIAPWIVTLALCETACVAPPADLGELTGSTTTDASGGSADASADGDTASGTGAVPVSPCGPDGPECLADADRDCVSLEQDNAPDVHNPDQSDLDGDGLADEQDLCPSVLTKGGAALGDSDNDGIGNDCDPCRQAASAYIHEEAGVESYMLPRNIPSLADSDGDGIGDACDNCVLVPNCDRYGPETPWQPGDPISYFDSALCQTDDNNNMVGDACEGMEAPGAAGPVGLGASDDFDQDGLSNQVDACPRLPLANAIACTTNAECPAGRKCEVAEGLCDHVDSDNDLVGDACDSCIDHENPLQVQGLGVDDADGDFIGDVCDECSTRTNPARTGFYPVSAGGWCCTVQYPGDGELVDPDGLPIMRECDDETSCRSLPAAVVLAASGVATLPPGCDAALADVGLDVASHLPLTAADVGGVEALWAHSCRLPPLDQDFDGLPDRCDSCPHAFDPEGLPYVDERGTVWPDAGHYCNGAYSLETMCG